MLMDYAILSSQYLFRASRILAGEGLTTLGANAEEHDGFDNLVVETHSSNPASLAVIKTQKSVETESRYTLSTLQGNNDASSFAATTHGRPLGGVIGELDAKSFRGAKRFGYERLAIKR